MNLHLLNLPGAYPIQDIVTASKPCLAARPDPVLVYLPAATETIHPEHVEVTRTAFEHLAEVEILDLSQPVPWVDLKRIMQRATVLYIPGGNTYLLLDRLRTSGAFSLVQTRVQAGMLWVGFSAGMVVCGPNILTTNNINVFGITEVTGLGFTEYNFVAHYPADEGEERARRDSQIRAYHNAHTNPVLALEDDGWIQIDEGGTQVVRGRCWLFEPGQEKRLLKRSA
jgi:dipeptidase E